MCTARERTKDGGGGKGITFRDFLRSKKGIADSSWCSFCENAIPLLYTREPRRRRENWKRRKRQVRGYSQGLSSIIPKASPPAERRSWGENHRLSLSLSIGDSSFQRSGVFLSLLFLYPYVLFCARFFLSHMEMCRLARAFSLPHLRGESRKGKEIRGKEKISHFSPLSPPPPSPRRRRKLWESSISTSREIAKKNHRCASFEKTFTRQCAVTHHGGGLRV